MNEDLSYRNRFPYDLDKGAFLVNFEANEILPGGFLAFVLILKGYNLAALFSLFVLPFLIARIKKRFPRGTLKMIGHNLGLYSIKGVPEFYKREWQG